MVDLPWERLAIGFGFALVAVLVLYAIQLRTRNAGTADIGWTFAVGGMAVYLAITGDGDAGRRAALAIVTGIWSCRLGLHILLRTIGHEEDSRYRALRQSAGRMTWLVFLLVYCAQPLLAVLISIPFLIAAENQAPFPGVWDLVGIVVWIIAVSGEATADRQLARFKRDPSNRGQVCRKGLWRYSRHPNYFFEWLTWWAYVALAMGHPSWWLALSAPAVMGVFLLKITGVPTVERQALKSKPEAYREYQRTTSVFVPWFPKE